MVMSGCENVTRDPDTGELVRCLIHTLNKDAGVWYENSKCKQDKSRVLTCNWEEPEIKTWWCGDCGHRNRDTGWCLRSLRAGERIINEGLLGQCGHRRCYDWHCKPVGVD